MYARYIPPAKGAKDKPHFTPPPVTAAPEPLPLTTVNAGGSSYARFIPSRKPDKIQEKAVPASVAEDVEINGTEGRKRKRGSLDEVVPTIRQEEDETVKKNRKKEEKKENKKKKKKDEIQKKGKDTPEDAKSQTDGIDSDTTANSLLQPPELPTASNGGKPVALSAVSEDVVMRGRIGDPSLSENASADAKPRREKREKTNKSKSSPEEPEEDDVSKDRHKAVLERRAKSLKLAEEADTEVLEEIGEDDGGERYDLEPLPQPEQPADTGAKPSYETLPSWLASPTRVDQATKMPFTDLGILPKAAKVLSERGYSEAFAVQTAAIPLLLPSSQHKAGDVLMSAATGSGKTLAYALPIVRDLSQGVITRLRALVVLPTRELVKQAQETFELCAKAYEGGDRKRVRVGVSIGSQSLKSEEESLVESEARYDRKLYDTLQVDDEHNQIQRSRRGQWYGEVIDYHSRVDVLICTPGRLVEHLEHTTGFHLDYVRWLVVDEADKILAQSFQGWLELVMDQLRTNKRTARDFPDMDFSGVRKVILSATLTRDVSLLNQLGLCRPHFIILEGAEHSQIAEHTLPNTLREHAIRVHDDSLKPLYLLDLLKGGQMNGGATKVPQRKTNKSTPLGSHHDNDSSSDDSDTSSEGTSSDESDSDSDTDTSSSGSSSDASTMPAASLPYSLIFTKSNESALRLSRLLYLLDKSVGCQTNTLTSTTASSERRKTLKAFTSPPSSSGGTRLLIASDLVARGIDIPKLDHVINYDLPPSVAGYVHRVGRTARADRTGHAWTLVADGESGWFWGKIAKSPDVRRAQKVDRVRIEERTETEVQQYEEALTSLGQEASQSRQRR